MTNPTDDAVILALDPQHIQTNAPLHRRASLEKIRGFRVGLPCCQERDLMLRLARDGARFSRAPGVFHTVRLHTFGVSTDELRVLHWMRPLLEESYEYLQARGQLTDDRKRAFAVLMARQGRVLVRYRKLHQAREYFEIAKRMHASAGLGAFSPLASRLARVVGPAITEEVLVPIKAFSRLMQPLFHVTRVGRSHHDPFNPGASSSTHLK